MKLKLHEPRKIVSVGYSFLITLPHAWLNHHEIGKGDTLDFEIDDDASLIIKPLKKKGGEHGRAK